MVFNSCHSSHKPSRSHKPCHKMSRVTSVYWTSNVLPIISFQIDVLSSTLPYRCGLSLLIYGSTIISPTQLQRSHLFPLYQPISPFCYINFCLLITNVFLVFIFLFLESTDVTPEYLLSCMLSGSYYMPPETLLRSQSSAGTARHVILYHMHTSRHYNQIQPLRVKYEGRRIRYKSYRKMNPTWISMKQKSDADGGSHFVEVAYANIPRLTFDASGKAACGVFRCSTACNMPIYYCAFFQ